MDMKLANMNIASPAVQRTVGDEVRLELLSDRAKQQHKM